MSVYTDMYIIYMDSPPTWIHVFMFFIIFIQKPCFCLKKLKSSRLAQKKIDSWIQEVLGTSFK